MSAMLQKESDPKMLELVVEIIEFFYFCGKTLAKSTPPNYNVLNIIKNLNIKELMGDVLIKTNNNDLAEKINKFLNLHQESSLT